MGLGVWNTEPGLDLDLFYTQININSGYGPTEGYSELRFVHRLGPSGKAVVVAETTVCGEHGIATVPECTRNQSANA